jgi:hypothetical protein
LESAKNGGLVHKLIIAAGVLAMALLSNGAVIAADRQITPLKLSDEVVDQVNELNRAISDLVQTQKTDEMEIIAAQAILISAYRAQNFAEYYSQLLGIYGNMTNDKDKSIVLLFVRIYHDSIKSGFNNRVSDVSEWCTRLASSALISPCERIRDNIRRIQDKVKSWTP